MRPTLFLVLAALFAGCPSVGDDDDSDCGDVGTLRVCASYGEGAAAGSASVRDTDGVETDALLDDEGCAEFALAPGAVEWRASHANDSCQSAWAPASVSACEVTDVQIQLIDWCLDGR